MKLSMELKTKLFGIMLVFLIIAPSPVAGENDNDQGLRINPEFKISRISNGSVIVTSKNPQESAVKHEFSDFYADLLMAAYRKQSMGLITDMLRKKYYMSEDECRRELKHAINILAEWKIILRDEDLALQ
jgi:hypothetical protein